jgi:hypothetical protein
MRVKPGRSSDLTWCSPCGGTARQQLQETSSQGQFRSRMSGALRLTLKPRRGDEALWSVRTEESSSYLLTSCPSLFSVQFLPISLGPGSASASRSCLGARRGLDDDLTVRLTDQVSPIRPDKASTPPHLVTTWAAVHRALPGPPSNCPTTLARYNLDGMARQGFSWHVDASHGLARQAWEGLRPLSLKLRHYPQVGSGSV